MMGRILAVALVATLVGACAAEAGDDEPENFADSTAEVSSRCAGTTASKSAVVKVMSMNLRHDDDQWERRFALIADEIVRLDPDLIGTQEVEIGKDQADKLNDLIARRGHAKYNLYTKRKSGWKGYLSGEGIGIFSRWPITEKEHEDTGEMRVSIIARVKHPSGGFIDFADTHLDHHGGADGDANRDDEMKQTIDLINENDDCHPTFLVGDMNASEGSPAIKRVINASFADSFRQVHGEQTATLGNTSPIVLAENATQNPRRRIDFVFGRGAGARTVKARDSIVCFKNKDAKGFYPSDHLGVMTTYDVRM